MAAPTSRLHGPSTSGSAAAPVSDPAPPAPSAPASTAPRPRSARRSMRPLPATNSNGGDFAPALLVLALMAFLPNIAVAENIAVCAADEKPRAGGTAFLAPLA